MEKSATNRQSLYDIDSSFILCLLDDNNVPIDVSPFILFVMIALPTYFSQSPLLIQIKWPNGAPAVMFADQLHLSVISAIYSHRT